MENGEEMAWEMDLLKALTASAHPSVVRRLATPGRRRYMSTPSSALVEGNRERLEMIIVLAFPLLVLVFSPQCIMYHTPEVCAKDGAAPRHCPFPHATVYTNHRQPHPK
jgi:hypothetical protein